MTNATSKCVVLVFLMWCPLSAGSDAETMRVIWQKLAEPYDHIELEFDKDVIVGDDFQHAFSVSLRWDPWNHWLHGVHTHGRVVSFPESLRRRNPRQVTPVQTSSEPLVTIKRTAYAQTESHAWYAYNQPSIRVWPDVWKVDYRLLEESTMIPKGYLYPMPAISDLELTYLASVFRPYHVAQYNMQTLMWRPSQFRLKSLVQDEDSNMVALYAREKESAIEPGKIAFGTYYRYTFANTDGPRLLKVECSLIMGGEPLFVNEVIEFHWGTDLTYPESIRSRRYDKNGEASGETNIRVKKAARNIGLEEADYAFKPTPGSTVIDYVSLPKGERLEYVVE